MTRTLTSFYVCILITYNAESGTWKNVADIHNDVLIGYNTDILPVENQSNVLNIDVETYFVSINGLDEPTGKFTASFGLVLQWNDTNLMWNTSDYGGQTIVQMNTSKIWTPSLVLVNPSTQPERLGNNGIKATVCNNGLVIWVIGCVLETICDVDVANFPFDEQICHIKIQTWDYGEAIKFNPGKNPVELKYFIGNGVWELRKAELSTGDFIHGSLITISLYLDRQITFYALNILTPIFFLALLNTFIFLLPTESGERIGFCVTILLSITVYMTVIADILPNSSNPTSILTYVLVLFLFQSSSICIESILSMRIYHRTEILPVSSWWFKIANCLSGKRRKVHVSKVVLMGNDGENACQPSETKMTKGDIHHVCAGGEEITWKDISRGIDTFLLYFNFTISILLASAYFVMCLKDVKV